VEGFDLTTLKEEHLQDVAKRLQYCSVCDSDDAVVRLDGFNFAYIWCDKCQKAYYEAPLSPSMFTYKNKLLRVESDGGRFISMESSEEESFRNEKDFKYAKKNF